MPGGDSDSNGTRVTTREFYDALLRQNVLMAESERRIIARLDAINACMPKLENQVETNKDEIASLRKKSDAWNAGNTAGVIIAGILSAIGINNR